MNENLNQFNLRIKKKCFTPLHRCLLFDPGAIFLLLLLFVFFFGCHGVEAVSRSRKRERERPLNAALLTATPAAHSRKQEVLRNPMEEIKSPGFQSGKKKKKLR